MPLFVGTAGWSIAKQHADRFGDGGSALERYATRFDAVEINSSFYRPHRFTTWERWAATTPEHFRFSAKLPKTITHERRLTACAEPLGRFLNEAGGLGEKLAVLIAQLPPSLAFDANAASDFFATVGSRTAIALACEPRHTSWFTDEADALLAEHRVARVAADPARVPAAAEPGGWPDVVYRRLHGAPRMYRTPYSDDQLDAYAVAVRAELTAGADAWCMFDNTMTSAATPNALDLLERFPSSRHSA